MNDGVSPATVSVLIPWRDSDPTRGRAMRHIVDWYSREFPDWQLILSDDTPGRWSKGAAVAQARARATGSVLVVADADSLVIPQALEHVVAAIAQGQHRWGIPYTWYLRLSEGATEAVYATQELPGPRPRLALAGYRGIIGAGIVAVDADAYDEAPIDPRFLDWGCEDVAWGLALNCLHGSPLQLGGNLWHLWHEQAPNRGAPDPASIALGEEYTKAARIPRHMRCVLAGKEIPPAERVQPVTFRASMPRQVLRAGPIMIRFDQQRHATFDDQDIIDVLRAHPGVTEVTA